LTEIPLKLVIISHSGRSAPTPITNAPTLPEGQEANAPSDLLGKLNPQQLPEIPATSRKVSKDR
jgi:hypothetical protein